MNRAAAFHFAGEGLRYAGASAAALCLDFGLYVGLIRLAGVHYLIAAPVGFLAGLALVYALSVRWVFSVRRHADRRVELGVFAAIGLGGVLLNQALIYAGVELASLSYEAAKIAAAGAVFLFNFGLRKLLLFTRRP